MIKKLVKRLKNNGALPPKSFWFSMAIVLTFYNGTVLALCIAFDFNIDTPILFAMHTLVSLGFGIFAGTKYEEIYHFFIGKWK